MDCYYCHKPIEMQEVDGYGWTVTDTTIVWYWHDECIQQYEGIKLEIANFNIEL